MLLFTTYANADANLDIEDKKARKAFIEATLKNDLKKIESIVPELIGIIAQYEQKYHKQKDTSPRLLVQKACRCAANKSSLVKNSKTQVEKLGNQLGFIAGCYTTMFTRLEDKKLSKDKLLKASSDEVLEHCKKTNFKNQPKLKSRSS